jgi:hypothetical protein
MVYSYIFRSQQRRLGWQHAHSVTKYPILPPSKAYTLHSYPSRHHLGSHPPPFVICPRSVRHAPFASSIILLPLQRLLKRPATLQSLCGSTIVLAATVFIARIRVVCLGVRYAPWRAFGKGIALPLLRRAWRLHQTPQPTLLQSPIHFGCDIDMFDHVAIGWWRSLGAWCWTLVYRRGHGLVLRSRRVCGGCGLLRAFNAESLVRGFGLH